MYPCTVVYTVQTVQTVHGKQAESMAGCVPNFFNRSFRFVRLRERTIVPQERRPALADRTNFEIKYKV